jgi:hypothetical protein
MKGHLVMIAAIGLVVALFTVLGVQLSLARIDMNDPRTWPDVGPAIKYFFIPVLTAFVALVAVVVNFALAFVDHRRLSQTKHWATLGVAFGLVAVAQPAAALGVNGPIVLWFSVVAALLAAILIRRRYGVPSVRNTV